MILDKAKEAELGLTLSAEEGGELARTMKMLSTVQQGTDYFEVTIVDGGQQNIVAVGVAPEGYSTGAQPGWNAGSVGYHGDDGGLFAEGAAFISGTAGAPFRSR
jgi:hypothetical protein